jgi:putative Holliday junction resolvase
MAVLRAIGLDIGERTCGVALSDAMGWTAQPVTTIRFKGSFDLKPAFMELGRIIHDNDVKVVVAGLPLNMNGTEGPQSKKARDFVDGLKVFLSKGKGETDDIEWIFLDERLSTSGASRSLIQADLSRAKRKDVIDKMAAVFILQGYLDSKA